MYFGYDSTWWRNLPLASQYAISTTPLRQTYDFAKSPTSEKAVLNPSYTDKSRCNIMVYIGLNYSFESFNNFIYQHYEGWTDNLNSLIHTIGQFTHQLDSHKKVQQMEDLTLHMIF